MDPFRTVHQQSGAYPVWVGRGLLEHLRELIDTLGTSGDVFLLLAEGIAEIWGERIHAGLGADVKSIAFPDSEEKKTLDNVEGIISSLLDAGARRDALLVIAGGGTAGDAAGLAASIFMRGVKYVHVPTTLLAQVDSCLGGKLAVNHPSGKNLIGVFAPPAAVVADLDTLTTLPLRELRSGMFEALKGGVLGDRQLFELMEAESDAMRIAKENLDEIVSRAIDVKISVIEADEREGDRRRLLNYGHTIGHGFEAATGYASLTHGDAVAWGMIAANAIAQKRGLIDEIVRRRLDEAILAYGPDPLPSVELDRIMQAVRHDKKFREGRRVMVFPVEIGRCEVFEDVSEEELAFGARAAIEASAAHEARD